MRRVYLWTGATALVLALAWVALEGRAAPVIGLALPAQAGLVALALFCFVAAAARRPGFFKRFVGSATPESLGAIRVLVCGILLLTALPERLASVAVLPPEIRWGMGLMRVFYALPIGFDRLVQSEAGLQAFQALTILLLFLGMVGWRTRVVLPLALVAYYAMFGILRQYSFFWHQGLVPLYVLAVLCFTPCGDGLSVDRLRRLYRGPTPPADRPSAVYGWARYACWVPITLTYLAAGLSKLRDGGPFWGSATNMRAILLRDSLDPMHQFDWGLSQSLADLPDAFFVFLGASGMYMELLYPLVLFSRVARVAIPLSMLTMHVGILFLQNILFFDLILLQLVFFDFTAVRTAVARWIAARRPPVQVLYDGACGLCRRTIRLLGALDLLGRLEPVDFRPLDLEAWNRRHGLRLAQADLEEEMYVVAGGRPYRGFAGYQVLALVLPPLWPLAPWLYLPGASALGSRAYGYVARDRLRLLRCDEACPVEVPAASEAAAPATPPAARAVPEYALVSGLAALMLTCWTYRVEFYPFTAVQMYSVPFTSQVTYYKALARRQSGVVSRAGFEAALDRAAPTIRYRHIIWRCFDPKKLHQCEKFLAAIGAESNRKAPPGERVTEFDIQKWVWDFRASPKDPDRGVMVDRFVFPLQPQPAAAAAR